MKDCFNEAEKEEIIKLRKTRVSIEVIAQKVQHNPETIRLFLHSQKILFDNTCPVCGKSFSCFRIRKRTDSPECENLYRKFRDTKYHQRKMLLKRERLQDLFPRGL